MESLEQLQVTYSPVDTFISCVKCLNVHMYNNLTRLDDDVLDLNMICCV